jgi:hypothetical protein
MGTGLSGGDGANQLPEILMSDVLHMAQLDLPDTLGGVRIGELAALTRPDHPFNELVESECSQKCGQC